MADPSTKDKKPNENQMIINRQNIRCQWESLARVSGIKDMKRSIYIDLGDNVDVNRRGDKKKEMNSDDKLAVKIIMQMYSLETFLYSTLNRASRERDQTRITNLGPFAFLLSRVLQRFDPKINQEGNQYIY